MPEPVTVCVLTYNGEHLLQDCLASIDAQIVPHELVIVDNGSTDPVWLPGRSVIHLEQNVGNIGGTNACMDAVNDGWVLFVANDVRLDPRCLFFLLETVRIIPAKLGMVQPILYQSDGAIDNAGLDWVWPGYGRRRREYTVGDFVPIVANTCWLMHKRTWEDVGPMDESLGISHEDIDYGLRLAKAGYQNWVDGLAEATHLMGQTIGRVTTGPLSPRYHQARQAVIRKHYTGTSRAVRLGLTSVLDTLAALRLRR